jgi:WD40 repeat protein
VALTRAGRQIALAQGPDVYFYALPAWTRDLPSRVTTFSSVRAVTYVTGRGQLALGLENGYLWVLRPTTGGIVWLLPAYATPVTALAAHPRQPYLLSGAENGGLRLWDMDAGQALTTTTFQGYTNTVLALAFSPDGAQAVSADADGGLIVWDVAEGRTLYQKTMADYTLTSFHWTEQGLAAGTAQGEGLLFSPELDFTVLVRMDAAITALAEAEHGVFPGRFGQGGSVYLGQIGSIELTSCFWAQTRGQITSESYRQTI